jgi:GNAT superfamily N-acetyltransferase
MPERSGLSMETRIVQADLGRAEHREAVLRLTHAYAQDPMGNGKGLADDVQQRLVPALAQHPGAVILLAYRDGEAVGIATCFLGFSTFAARPLLNIHDLAVLPELRGQGIGRQLLQAVARRARELGCCKLTLEVYEKNPGARALYESEGFGPAADGESGSAMRFLAKPL